MKLKNTPIYRIYTLTVDNQNSKAVLEEGQNNILTSINNEAGTLAMFLAHDTEEQSINYMVEVYQDEQAYQTHVASPQFNHYREHAANLVASTKMIDLQTEFIATKEKKFAVNGQSDLSIHLAKVSVKDGTSQEFAEVVEKEMRISVAEEDGVLAMLAGTDKNHPNDWYFYEIYKDDDAYSSHIKSQQFKDYIAGSQNLLTDKKLHLLSGDILFSQGQLEFNN